MPVFYWHCLPWGGDAAALPAPASVLKVSGLELEVTYLIR